MKSASSLPSFVFSASIDQFTFRLIRNSSRFVLVAIFVLASSIGLIAQTSEWVWMGGSSTPNKPGIYGTLGVSAPSNSPGGRAIPATWIDSNGNHWIFGGYGCDSRGATGYLNDLWELSASSGEWIWMGGSNTAGQPGVYGTLGVPAATNIPGGRVQAVAWTDNRGNLWLFGGQGTYTAGTHYDLNDLWEFSTATLEWTWMGGGITPTHVGTLGVPAVGNIPSVRDTAAGWADASGNLWLFGGEDPISVSGGGAGSSGLTNDLWEFNTATSEWAWMGGNTSQAVGGVYGTLGTLSSSNFPGSRNGAILWTDNSDNHWLFGGLGLDANSSQGFLNDLWQFNSSGQDWVWMAGSKTQGTAGLYGTLGQPAPGDQPGGRGIGASWIDAYGNLWLFGGQGSDANRSQGFLNDLWQFNPLNREWTWMGGSNVIGTSGSQPGVYGTLGTTAAGNTPGGRMGADSWTDNNGNLWLFGGVGSASTGVSVFYNDLWEYRIAAPTLPPAAAPTFSVTPGIYTSPLTVTISDATAGATIYYTTNGIAPTTNSTIYNGPIRVSATATLEAIAIATSYSQSAVASANYTITNLAAATPAFSMAQGTYPSPLAVTLNDGTTGATIYYTTDGTAPTTGSTVYRAPITVYATETIEAIAVAAGYLPSEVAVATYTISSSTTRGEWAWMGGGSTVPGANLGQPGVYGTLGVPAVGNAPGGRESAVGWTDKAGNFWLFGGIGTDSNGNSGLFNDLWEFNSSLGEWVWISGNTTLGLENYHLYGSPAVYGALGVPASGNTPGGRSGSATWTDLNGNLWLFGGQGFDPFGASAGLNDLWKFNIATSEWTWMGGPNTEGGVPGCNQGIYGTLGVAAAGNMPGCRSGAVVWTDSGGNLWLFGGHGADSQETSGYLNDLWEFKPSTLQWTWMGGSSTLPSAGGQPGVYGTKGVATAGNTPGGRSDAPFWADKNGNIWIFGGTGFDSTGTLGWLNDLWAFNPATFEWTWMGGSNIVGQPGSYGTLGVPAAGNVPGNRAWASSWTDAAGDLWLFGGDGQNDLWEFNPSTSEWAWMGGFGQPYQSGVYGTLGVPAPGDFPGSRNSAVTWSDRSGNLWLFGGQGIGSASPLGYLNDLWEFQPFAGALPAAAPSFSIAAGSYATAQAVTISDTTPGAIIYYTSDGSTPTANSTVYSGAITVTSSETLQAIAYANSYSSSPVASAAYTIMQTPAITWGAPAAITYGTALGASQLNASSTVAGTFSYSPATGAVLAAGQQTLTATFTPTDTTDYAAATASVSITVNPATSTVAWATPAAITYGTALGASQLDANASVPGSLTYLPAAGTVLAVGQQTLTATFTPTDSTDYTPATATVTLTVNQAPPAITWGAPTAITYGNPLGAAQLNATSTVAGTFSYSPAAGTVLAAGQQTLTATFTPTDSTDYTPATATVALTVNQATPTITWATPSAITYGTALGASQLNATSTVAGSFSYSPAGRTVLAAGQQTLTATFTPTDSTDYAAAAANVSISVSKATPTVTWSAPGAIVYGTALSSAQLDAKSTVSGTFNYSPSAGNVLAAGTQTLSVTFTPTDTADFSPVTATASLTVTKSTPTIAWPTPASIVAGKPLSGTQLDATASVPGTFAYSPAAGAVPAAGNQTLTTVFTPTDSADYNSRTASVVLVVKPAPSFTLSASSSSLTEIQGKSGTDTITVAGQNGFNSSVTLSTSGLPTGVTANFGTNPTTGSSVLTFKASSSAAVGTYAITVKGASGSLSASTTISLTIQSAFACHVGYSIVNSWPGGFEAALSINNTGTVAISNWTLTWTFANGQQITQFWNGNESQGGANVTINNLSYNGSIPAGGSYTGAGFNGSWNNKTNAVPTSFAINGTDCQ